MDSTPGIQEVNPGNHEPSPGNKEVNPGNQKPSPDNQKTKSWQPWNQVHATRKWIWATSNLRQATMEASPRETGSECR